MEMKIARGRVLTGFLISPAEAAIAENPKKVINTMAAVLLIRTKSVLNFAATSAISKLLNPPKINQTNRMTLPIVTMI